MFGMMKCHSFRRDDGFESIVIVGQVGQDGLVAGRGGGREVGAGRFGKLTGKLGGLDVYPRCTEGGRSKDFGYGGGGRHGDGASVSMRMRRWSDEKRSFVFVCPPSKDSGSLRIPDARQTKDPS